MEKEFVLYEQALALKELGFDEPCFTHYLKGNLLNNVILGDTLNSKFDNIRVSAPLYQQAFRWFEDNQSMFIERIVTTNANEIMDIEYNIKSWRFPTITIEFDDSYDSFDKNKSELDCLIKLISIVKEKEVWK